MTKEKKLLLMDGHSLAFRAFYGLASQISNMKNKNGLHTNALYGFHNMVEAKIKAIQPTHALVAFDAGKTTFRNEFFEDYKGGRDAMPAELSEQMPYFRELLDGLGIEYYELENYEADDIIGTLAKEAEEQGFETVIMTGDRDLAQLASGHIQVDFTKKGDFDEITPDYLEEVYGLSPEQVPDYLGLKGDPSDNIPGVTGIGEKRAQSLLDQFGSLDALYEQIDELKPSKMKENLIEQEEVARLSKKLATINREAPLQITVDDLEYPGKDLEKLIDFYKEMDFDSHLSKLDISDLDTEKEEEISYRWVTEISEDMLQNQQAVYGEMLDANYHRADIECVAWGDSDQVYVTSVETVRGSEAFKAWAEDESVEKYVFDAKAAVVSFLREGILFNNISFDVHLASYLLSASDHSSSVADVAAAHNYRGVTMDEVVYGKGKKTALPDSPDQMHQHVASKVKAVYELSTQLNEELMENEQEDLLKSIELPLAKVLAKMEVRGITVDAGQLKELQTQFQTILDHLEQEIYEKAGEEFNVNSPKQLGVILFEKMGYPVIRKTKTGYSTAQDVLEKLQDQAPIVDDILKYRQISKIQSTYVTGLLSEIGEDGRVHTRFLQTVARTGRLSSVAPNLQNIPIRTEEGRQIRKAFTANHEGWKIFASDYSQIELRVMAHISGDEHMTAAFKAGEDIHAATAARIFDLEDTDSVTPNMRRDAKTINFGIIYGMSDYGLSESLRITRKEAQEFIDIYFERYPGIKNYMDNIKREARDKGYVETLFRRRRYLPDINARNFNQRTFAERTAINTPIQGSAADIIKMAMIEMEKNLEKEGLQAEMLLQVHDELIFEVPETEIGRLSDLVKDVMENIVNLDVPLEIESHYGDNWYDTED